MRLLFTATVGLAAVFAATASAQRADRKVDMPIVRNFNWFSYVAADDIRRSCSPGGRSQMRLVYNAQWREQVRTYEIFLQPDGTAGLALGVLGKRGVVADITLNRPADILSPWNMIRGERILDAGETRELVGLFEASGAFGPPPDGLRLPDNDYWWTVASCRDGIWGFQAYHFPTDAFANVKFAEALFRWDNVPVPISYPRKLEPSEFRGGTAERWILVVAKDGLRPR